VPITRAVFAGENADVELFVLDEAGTRAVRTHVRHGAASVSMMDVVSSFNTGDRMIVSDTSNCDRLGANSAIIGFASLLRTS
jgi:hypothetical protein